MGADATWPSGASASAGPLRVGGVAVGRFPMIDGRPQDDAWAALQMVERFEPGTVPILARHRGGPFGTVDTLHHDGPDLHFTGTIVPYPDIIELLRRPHAISIEQAHVGVPYYGPRAHRPAGYRHPFRGELRPGINLTAIALSERPATRGSVMWIIRA